MAQALEKIKEIALVERFRRGFGTPDPSVIVAIGDDAAAVALSPDRCLLLTSDMLVESVHFRRGEDPRRVGYKALAVSVSDIAAMGGWPKYALVSVGLPSRGAARLASGLLAGIRRCARKFGVAVIGGDTNRSGRLVVDVTVIGEVEKKKMALRSGARPGDHVFVSGPLGGSGRGKHLTFTPRVREARFLVENFRVTSMIDLSDGLAMDAARVARASGAGILLFEQGIPRAPAARTTAAALFDGEDFELLFTVPAAQAAGVARAGARRKTPFVFYPVGRVTDLFKGVKMLRRGGRLWDVPCAGFRHF